LKHTKQKKSKPQIKQLNKLTTRLTPYILHTPYNLPGRSLSRGLSCCSLLLMLSVVWFECACDWEQTRKLPEIAWRFMILLLLIILSCEPMSFRALIGL